MGTGMKILVVDDDEAVREALTHELRAEGHDVEAAASGAEALRRAEARPPDLLLLDYMMPGMDGSSVIEGVRAASRLRTVPVVLVTAAAPVPEDATIGFLRKPVRLEALSYLVNAFAADAAEGAMLGRALKVGCTRCNARPGVWCGATGDAVAKHLHSERLAASVA